MTLASLLRRATLLAALLVATPDAARAGPDDCSAAGTGKLPPVTAEAHALACQSWRDGRVLERDGLYDRAIPLLERSLAAWDVPRTRLGLARAHANLGHWEDALVHALMAMKLDGAGLDGAEVRASELIARDAVTTVFGELGPAALEDLMLKKVGFVVRYPPVRPLGTSTNGFVPRNGEPLAPSPEVQAACARAKSTDARRLCALHTLDVARFAERINVLVARTFLMERAIYELLGPRGEQLK